MGERVACLPSGSEFKGQVLSAVPWRSQLSVTCQLTRGKRTRREKVVTQCDPHHKGMFVMTCDPTG
jgi:hypothetical protein